MHNLLLERYNSKHVHIEMAWKCDQLDVVLNNP